MNTSTATLNDPSDSRRANPNVGANASADLMVGAAMGQSKTTQSSGSIEFPEFGSTEITMAHATRSAARQLAALVTDAEFEALLKERQELISKKLDGSLTRRENTRLDYVHWSLDRIEDAKYGDTLDGLEDHISRYENFLAELDDFKARLDISRRTRR
jgi:hypothetical protein